MENIYHNLKGNTNPKTISNINRWNRPQLRDWKADSVWLLAQQHISSFTYVILDLSLSLYRQVPLNFSLSNSNTQINHWRTFISMHWHFFSLSLVTIWTILFKFRTDSREHGSIRITSVQLYKFGVHLKDVKFSKSVYFWLLWTCCRKFNRGDLQLFDQKLLFPWYGNAYLCTKLCHKVKRNSGQRHSK